MKLENTLLSTIVLSAALFAGAVDRSKFRTCDDTGFCKKFRHYEKQEREGYVLNESTIKHEPHCFSSQIFGASEDSRLNLKVFVTATGVVRVQISEDVERWQPVDILQEEGLRPGKYITLDSSDPAVPETVRSSGQKFVALSLHSEKDSDARVLIIYTASVKFELYHAGIQVVAVNERNLMHFEKTQSKLMLGENSEHGGARSLQSEGGSEPDTPVAAAAKPDKHQGKEIVGYGEDGLALYADGTQEVADAHLEEDEDNEDDIDIDGEHVDANARKLLSTENWEERFHSHTDSRPHGPMSVGVDFSFPFTNNVYGIPEHAAPMNLPPSVGAGSGKHYDQPYRMYNLDVFEYELDNTMALYGNIPFMMGHGVTGSGADATAVSAALFWFNPSETFIDVNEEKKRDSATNELYKQTHWLSESGLIDFFMFSGVQSVSAKPAVHSAALSTTGAASAHAVATTNTGLASVYYDYSLLTGFTALPALFALGYHQCRWNYRDEKDVAAVESKFEELDFPMDVIWLDIEHTDGKRYFTWDKNLFQTPVDMQQAVSAHGRKMVTIVDPHIKRDNHYHIHSEATAAGHYIKNKDGGDFDGWCWPGSSSYLDFTSPAVRNWWGEQFAFDKYIGSTQDLYTWNDMNEPSVFNGPEVSMPKDAKSVSGVEHREWHNLYGLYFHQATAAGLTMRDEKKLERPFVLSRAFWAGTQKHGAIWTGDNTASWGHLQIATPMLLSINIAGLSFAGADIGGFFGNPDQELMTRWYQAAAFTPFFRNHAHLDSKRREPWVFGEPTTSILRTATMIRYSLLPLWYTTFFESHRTGVPVMRPLFMEFPFDESVYKNDNSWMVGSRLLVKPVVESNKRSMDVYLPSGIWYDFFSYAIHNTVTGGSLLGRSIMLNNLNIETIPVYIRGGSVLMRKLRVRRSSKTMFYDPYTVTVAPDQSGAAHGTLYADDEHTLLYAQDAGRHSSYYQVEYSLKSAALSEITCFNLFPSVTAAADPYTPSNTVERVELLGQTKIPKNVDLKTINADTGAEEVTALSFHFDANRHTVVIKKPNVRISSAWKIELQYD